MAEPLEGDEKPTFSDLVQRYCLNTGRLARASGVSGETIEALFRGWPVWAQDACLVLTKLSEIVKENYTLENVDVPLRDENALQEEIDRIYQEINEKHRVFVERQTNE